jgi:hypothetical protein
LETNQIDIEIISPWQPINWIFVLFLWSNLSFCTSLGSTIQRAVPQEA